VVEAPDHDKVAAHQTFCFETTTAMTDFQDVDAQLEDWNALRTSAAFDGLLVGNGASRAVWDDFGYDSLFENARTVEEKPLSPSELSVFEALQTRSFEQVLSALKTTSRVNKALAVSSAAPRNRYYAIKEALINTVHAVHIPWRLVEASSLATISQELARYRTVFTTNYDLLNYWAIQQQPEAITDLFQGAEPAFDLSVTATDKTRLLYLHGGLHLVRNQDPRRRSVVHQRRTERGQAQDHPQFRLPVVLLRPVARPRRQLVHFRACPGRARQPHRARPAPGETEGGGDLDLPAQQGVHPASEAALREGVRGDGGCVAVF
jgi:hypothetical protein